MNFLLEILIFLWQLPQNFIALIISPFLGKKELICEKRKCKVYRCSKMRGGISLGNFVFVGNAKDTYIAHELGHVVDSHILGPLYLLIIGIPSLLWACCCSFNRNINYYGFYTEWLANQHSHLYVYRLIMNERNYWYLEFKGNKSLDSIK